MGKPFVKLHRLAGELGNGLDRVGTRKRSQVDGRITERIDLSRAVAHGDFAESCDLFGHLCLALGRAVFLQQFCVFHRDRIFHKIRKNCSHDRSRGDNFPSAAKSVRGVAPGKGAQSYAAPAGRSGARPRRRKKRTYAPAPEADGIASRRAQAASRPATLHPRRSPLTLYACSARGWCRYAA